MARTDPLIVYIHIPKTAGSTLNHILQRWDPAGLSHCEAIINDPVRLRAAVAKLTWISGHVTRDRMRAALSAVTDRPLRLFTVLREPTRQLMSHYNWLIEIYHRGPAFYDPHPQHIKAISEQIRGSDNSSPQAVIGNLKRYGGLFLNNQAKVALGDPPDWFGPKMVDRLRDYEAIATEQRFQDLIWQITDTDVTLDARENESGYHFDRAVFSDPVMQAFLRDHHAFDYRLYKLVLDQELYAGPLASGVAGHDPSADMASADPITADLIADDLTDAAQPMSDEDRLLREFAREVWRVLRADPQTPGDTPADTHADWARDRAAMLTTARKVARRLQMKGITLSRAPNAS